MTPEVFRVVLPTVLAVAFVSQSAAIVASVFYLRRLVVQFRQYLDLVAKHAALTAGQAAALTDDVKAEVRRIPHAMTTAILESLAAAGVPVPPPPPPDPAVPGRRTPDSVRALAALGIGALGVGALACGPARVADTGGRATVSHVSYDHADAGLDALKKGQLVRAEHEFTKAGDDVRLAEVFFRQARYDEAEFLVRGKEDGQCKFWLGMIARERGDHAEARRMFAQARNLGSDTGAAALAAYYPGA